MESSIWCIGSFHGKGGDCDKHGGYQDGRESEGGVSKQGATGVDQRIQQGDKSRVANIQKADGGINDGG